MASVAAVANTTPTAVSGSMADNIWCCPIPVVFGFIPRRRGQVPPARRDRARAVAAEILSISGWTLRRRVSTVADAPHTLTKSARPAESALRSQKEPQANGCLGCEDNVASARLLIGRQGVGGRVPPGWPIEHITNCAPHDLNVLRSLMFIHQRSVLPARFSSYLTAQIVRTSADPAAV